MATLNRYRVIWTGGPGGEGVSTFFSETSAITALADLRAFFLSIATHFPSVLTWSFPNSGDQLESATGTLVGGWTQAAASPVVGTSSGASFASGVGARVVWGTNGIVAGRRLKGATFLTSIDSTEFANDGTLEASFIASLQSAADTLVGKNSLSVWSRPRNGVSGFASIESATIPDRVTALRSRRY